MIRFIFLLALLPNLLFADYGIDYLLAGKYPEVVIENHPKGFACGFIWEVDGSPKTDKVINKLLISGKCLKTRIHLSWRDDHNFSEKDIPIAVAKAREVAKIVEKHPTVEFYVSPWLEHRASLSLLNKLVPQVKNALPSRVKYVNSYIDGGAYLPNEINEVHHTFTVPKGKYIHSFDGVTALDADVEKYKKVHNKAELFFFWDWSANSRYSSEDPTPRKDRKLKLPSQLIKSFVLMSKPKGKTSLPSKDLFKAYAEAEPLGSDHSKPIPRSWKPLFIVGDKADSIILKAKKKTVAIFKFEKKYAHGYGYVYRSSDWGIDIAEKILKLKKNTVANVWVGKKKLGKVNVVFRENLYRN